jgi:hypothetical protein
VIDAIFSAAKWYGACGIAKYLRAVGLALGGG